MVLDQKFTCVESSVTGCIVIEKNLILRAPQISMNVLLHNVPVDRRSNPGGRILDAQYRGCWKKKPKRLACSWLICGAVVRSSVVGMKDCVYCRFVSGKQMNLDRMDLMSSTLTEILTEFDVMSFLLSGQQMRKKHCQWHDTCSIQTLRLPARGPTSQQHQQYSWLSSDDPHAQTD